MLAFLGFTQILLLTIVFHSGEAKKCYICNSMTNPKCNDPMDTTLEAQECSSELLEQMGTTLDKFSKAMSDLGSSLGIKTQVPKINTNFDCLKIEYEADNKNIIQRSCTPSITKDLDTCKELRNSNQKIKFCGTCDMDLCNGSNGIHAALALLIPALALLLANS